MQVKVKSVSKDLVAVAALGALDAPSDVTFSAYRDNESGSVQVRGESQEIEYKGSTDHSLSASKFCVAALDPDTNTVELIPATLVPVEAVVKSRKRSLGPAIRQANVRNAVMRSSLGEAFGTKKAKKAIVDQERNRIDVGALDSLETGIIDVVKYNTKNLPTTEQHKQDISLDRPIPAYVLEATVPEDIYPVANIIPDKELKTIRTEPFMQQSDAAKRAEALPTKDSAYMASRLSLVLDIDNAGSLTKQTKVKYIYYASLLMCVYHNRRVTNRAALQVKCGDPPELLISGILERFTATRATHFGKSRDKSFAIDPAHENKLLCHLLALLLHIDNFLLEVAPLARELSLKPSRLVELLRALGCAIKNPTVAQAEALGLSKGTASSYKIATLSAPLKLPEMARRGRR